MTRSLAPLLIALVLAGNACADLTSNLGPYFKLDDGSGSSAADSSGVGATASLANTPTWGTGQIGGCLTLAGTSSQRGTFSQQSYGPGTAWTFAAWIRPTNNNDCAIVGGGDSTVDKIMRQTNGTSIQVRGNSGANDSFTASTPINTWSHLCVTNSTGNAKNIYVNGVVSSTGALTRSVAHRFGEFGSSGSGAEFWTGSLDDVRIYTRELTSGEVAALAAYTGAKTSRLWYQQSRLKPCTRFFLPKENQFAIAP